MAESAALLVDEVFPEQPVRQWVLSVPYPLRFLFASRPAIMGQVRGIVYRVIATHLIKKGRFHLQGRASGCGYADPAVCVCTEPQYPSPHAVPR